MLIILIVILSGFRCIFSASLLEVTSSGEVQACCRPTKRGETPVRLSGEEEVGVLERVDYVIDQHHLHELGPLRIAH